MSWYEKAAAQAIRMLLTSLASSISRRAGAKDVTKALEYLTRAAEQGSQYAQYTLGKLYLMGEDMSQDREQAYSWLWESAAQGNEYARFLLEHLTTATGNVLLAVTNLLHHMGRIFQDNSIPPSPPASQQADRKYQRQIQQKRIAMGHKPNDHEETQNRGGMTMSGW